MAGLGHNQFPVDEVAAGIRDEGVVENPRAKGIAGNANQGGKRQVTIISKEVWERIMAEMSLDLDPATRRANLMVSGDIDFADSRHKILQICGIAS